MMTLTVDHALLGALGLFVGKELYAWWKDAQSKNTAAVTANTHAIIKLEVRLEQLIKTGEAVPEMRRDIDGLHAGLRRIEARLSSNGGNHRDESP